MVLDVGGFEGKTIKGEIKRGDDFYQSIVDQRIYYQPQRMLRTGKQCFWILAGNPTDDRRQLSLVLDRIFELALHPGITLIPVPNNEAAIAYAIHTIIQKKDKEYIRPLPI